MIIGAESGNNDSGFVGFLADRNRRIDRDNDASKRREGGPVAPPLFDQIARPKRAWRIFEHLAL